MSQFDGKVAVVTGGNSGIGRATAEASAAEGASVVPELKVLKAEGIVIYLDDFGTDYSSLSYLRHIPAVVLNIYRAFINGLPHDSNAVRLVRAIIGVAKNLGLHVVAEGVETEDQLEILSELECDMAQGYLFSKPARPGYMVLQY